jgi:hypothetical protein
MFRCGLRRPGVRELSRRHSQGDDERRDHPAVLDLRHARLSRQPCSSVVVVPGSGPEMAHLYLDTFEESSLLGITYTSCNLELEKDSHLLANETAGHTRTRAAGPCPTALGPPHPLRRSAVRSGRASDRSQLW